MTKTLTVEQFKALKVGDSFEAGSLLKPVTDEKLVYSCRERLKHPDRGSEVAILVQFFHGVQVSVWMLELKYREIYWKEIEK